MFEAPLNLIFSQHVSTFYSMTGTFIHPHETLHKPRIHKKSSTVLGDFPIFLDYSLLMADRHLQQHVYAANSKLSKIEVRPSALSPSTWECIK